MKTLVMKEGDLFLIAAPSGDLTGGEAPHGLYYNDTRYLSQLQITVGGEPPDLLDGSATDNYQMRFFYQSNRISQTVYDQGRPGSVGLVRQRLIEAGVLYEQIEVTNYGLGSVSLELGVRFAADFRDLFEARGATRARRGEALPPQVGDGQVRLSYRGLDGLVRESLVGVAPAPSRLSEGEAVWQLSLAAGERQVVSVAVVPEGQAVPGLDFAAAKGRLAASYAAWHEGITQIETADPGLNRTLQRSQLDLRALVTDLGQGPFAVAGIPWFVVPFGRDSIITALQTLAVQPELAAGTLRTLAQWQGQEVNQARQEEPGKILHERRAGEMAQTGEVPFLRYYGSVDSTPLFLVLLGEYYRWTADLVLAAELLPNVLAALGWLEQQGEGFLTFSADQRGLGVQSWKDSQDSMAHTDGRLAPSPIAVSEVQGYVYDAYRRMASVLRALPEGGAARLPFGAASLADLADRLEAKAEELQARFDEAFWVAERDYYAIALDGEGRQVATISSDPGHCLWSGIVPPARRAAVVAQLMSSALFSGWGVRTLAEGETTFNPMSYHNGSVWPHDNSLIALGLKRAGFGAEAARLAQALFDTAEQFELNRLPELFCGYSRAFGPPVAYPASCSPQAWAAATPFILIQALLGLEPDAAAGVLRVAPQLPPGLSWLRLRGLRVGQAVVDLEVNETGVEHQVRAGALRVEVG